MNGCRPRAGADSLSGCEGGANPATSQGEGQVLATGSPLQGFGAVHAHTALVRTTHAFFAPAA
jgi:hypothetical protein